MKMNSTIAVCNDASFGPSVRGCRDEFDFTFKFEQLFFSIVPSSLFLLAAALRLSFLSRFRRKVAGNSFKNLKLSIVLLFAGIQLALLVLWARQSHVSARSAGLAASTLSFVVSLMLLPLSSLEHGKTLKPSVLLNAYLFLTTILDAAILRTLWSSPFSLALQALFTSSFVIRIVLAFMEAVEKRIYFETEYSQVSLEESSGFYGQGLLLWLNKIIVLGARQILKPDDLYPIAKDMTSEGLSALFWDAWISRPRPQSHALPKALIRMLLWPILAPVFPRLILLAFTFCQPLLLKRMLDYLSSPKKRQDGKVGYALIGAYAVVYIGLATSSAFYWHQQFRFIVKLRGVLATAIYRKSMEIDANDKDRTKSVTLMSTDCERITRGLRGFHDLWASVIQVALGTWLVERELGVACVAPIALAIVTTGITIYLSSFTTAFQLRWVEKVQSRTGLTASILGSMKGIKITNLAAKASNLLNASRRDELNAAGGFRLLGVLTSSLAYIPQFVSPVATFAIFVAIASREKSLLDPSRLFTSLSLLLLLSEPLFDMFIGIEDFMSAVGCIIRIEAFLATAPRIDKRTIARPSEVEPSLIQISVHEGSFGWSDSAVLKNVNLSIGTGEIVFLVGPVASGKTTLLNALLGETSFFKGLISIASSEIAWCGQSPWLQNGSIRSNILGCSRFDSGRYDTVVYSCDLQADFEMLANGDETTIGSKGFALSGGQRQRIALARALYSQKKIALLDDVFSQLDMHTRSKLLRRLLGSRGLFRLSRTTVVLSMSSEPDLSLADQVIRLDGQGGLTQIAAPEPKSSLVKDCDDSTTEQTDESKPNLKCNEVSKATEGSGKALDQTRQTGNLSVYRYYFASISSTVMLVFLAFQITLAFLSSFPTVWLKWWSDASTAHENDINGRYMGVYAALQASALIASALVTWWSFNVMAVSSGFNLHSILTQTVTTASFRLFSTTETGSILTRFTQDIGLIDIQLPLALQVVLTNLLICIAQTGLIASASAWIAISFPFLLMVFFFVLRYYLRTSRQMRHLDLEEKAPLYAQFLETLEGLTSIRAFSWIPSSLSHNHALVDRSQKPYYLMFMIQKWLALVLDLIIAALAILIVAVAVKLRDTISPGFTGVSLTQIISFTTYLKLMILFWAQMETSVGAVKRIKDFAGETEREYLPEVGSEIEVQASWPEYGRVEFEQLSASYKPESKEMVLKDLSMTIEPGQSVCICGRTGSGKSSLILSLLRLLPPSSGNIKIDSIPITTLPHSTIRSRIIAVAEEPFLFPGTVRQNLDPDGHASDQALIEALTDINLWTLISEKGGLDTKLEKEMLSHGQQQLFGIARAIVRRHTSSILVLDEVTSSLDHDSEAAVHRIIQTRFQNHTIIAVAHKLSFSLSFDKIAVMEQGRIIEFDKPSALLSYESTFKGLYESQVKRGGDDGETFSAEASV